MAKKTTTKKTTTKTAPAPKTVPCEALVTAVGVGVVLRKGKVADLPERLVAGLVKAEYIKAPDGFEAEKAPPPSEQPKTGGVEKRAPSGKQSKTAGEETR